MNQEIWQEYSIYVGQLYYNDLHHQEYLKRRKEFRNTESLYRELQGFLCSDIAYLIIKYALEEENLVSMYKYGPVYGSDIYIGCISSEFVYPNFRNQRSP